MKILDLRWGRAPAMSLLAISIASFGLTSASHGQFAQAALDDGAFAYWSMNESSAGGTSSLGTNPMTGSYPDTAQLEFGAAGLADPNFAAVRYKGFDDATTDAGFFDIDNSGPANSGGPWTQKTVEVWFSVDEVNSSSEQVIYEQGGSTRGITIYVRDGKLYAGAHNSNGDSGSVASPWPAGALGNDESELAVVTTDIASNTPYYLALVLNGAEAFNEDLELDGTLTGYLNGVEFDSRSGIGTLYGHTDPIRVAGSSGQLHFDPGFSGVNPFGNDGLLLDPPAATATAPYFFRGVVDDLALYNVALSAEQVQAHYAARDYLAGDFDADGQLGMGDFLILSANFNLPGSYQEGDMSFDGQIDIEDFSMFRRAFHAASAGGTAAVPEPTSWLLFLFSALLVPWFRRSRIPSN